MLIGGLLSALSVGIAEVQAVTKLTANRNVESDMASYKVYACLTAGCTVTQTGGMLQTTIPQPGSGGPQWILPLETEGQSTLSAVDLTGNESGLGNIVNYRCMYPRFAPGVNLRR